MKVFRVLLNDIRHAVDFCTVNFFSENFNKNIRLKMY